MLKMVYYELYKAVRKKGFLIAAAVLLAANLLLLWYGSYSGGADLNASSYRKLMSDMEKRTCQERYQYIEGLYDNICGVELVEDIQSLQAAPADRADAIIKKLKEDNPGVYEKYYSMWKDGTCLVYTDNLRDEAKLIKQVYQEEQLVSNYQGCLKDIAETSRELSEVSIFSHSSFSKRNIEKTAKDYSTMGSVIIDFTPSRGFASAATSKITDILILLSILAFSSGLILEEKEKGLYAITKSTVRGGFEYISAKLAALFIYCIVAVVAFYGCSLAFYGCAYGLGNINASIQSFAPFMKITLKLTGAGYLGLCYITKLAVFFCIGLVIVLVSIHAKQPYLPAVITIIVLCVCWALTELIPAISDANWLKYLNLYGLLQTDELYGRYINLNCFGKPVSCFAAAQITIVFFSILLYLGCCYSFTHSGLMELRDSFIKRWLDSHCIVGYKPHTSLIKHESYKIFIMSGVLPILLVFCGFLTYNTLNTDYYISSAEKRYCNYMEDLKGPLTQEKEDYLNKERAVYEDAMNKLAIIDNMEKTGQVSAQAADSMRASYDNILSFYNTFQRVWENYEYIKIQPGAEFVYETGYMRLLGFISDTSGVRLLLFACIIALCLGNIYAMEYKCQVNRIISTAYLGLRSVSLCKIYISLGIAFLCYVSIEAANLIGVIRSYALPGLSYPANSLRIYSWIPGIVPIWGMLIGIYLVRLSACIASGCIMLYISQRLQNQLQGIFLFLLLVGIGPLLYIIGLPAARWLSFLPLYQAPAMLSSDKGIGILLIYLCACIFLCIWLIHYLITVFESK